MYFLMRSVKSYSITMNYISTTKRFYTFVLSMLLLAMVNHNLYAQCPAGEKIVQINITADANFDTDNTRWEVLNESNASIFATGTFGQTICVPDNECFIFKIYDDFGNGFANTPPGSYSIYYDGILVDSDINFGDEKAIDFGACTAGQSCSFPINITSEGNFQATNPETWYEFVPTATGRYTVATCNLNNSCDTRIWGYDRCDGIVEEQSQQEATFFSDNDCNGNQATATTHMTAGVPYYIRIGDSGTSCQGTAINWELIFEGPVEGCTDPSSCNFNPLATIDDGSCNNPCPDGPDLIVLESAISNSLSVQNLNNDNQCYIAEGCIKGYGARQILRFTTHIKNIGNQDYYIGSTPSDPSQADEQWEWDECHGHWHYEGYAEYLIFDENGNALPVGFKNGFCVIDLECSGGGTATYNCSNQGITAGCGDIYSSGLACQWIDLTDVPEGNYSLVVRVNWDKTPDALGRDEISYDNNWAQVCFSLTRDAAGDATVTEITNCPAYTDCLGQVQGDAQLDCEGVCNGTNKAGDLNDNELYETDDVLFYIDYILDDDLTPSPCTDISDDGVIGVLDPVLLLNCIIDQANGIDNHNHAHGCSFPSITVENDNQSAIFSIGDHNLAEKYIDVYIQNSQAHVLSFNLQISGITISDIQTLITNNNYNPDFYYDASGEIIGFSLDQSFSPRYGTDTPFMRVYYSNTPTTDICIDEVISVVNEKYEIVQTAIGTNNCASNSGTAPEYCTLEGNNTNYEWIQQVQIASIDNNSGSNAGYGDFTALSTNLNAGSNYGITLTPGFNSSTYDEYWNVWIDFNYDGDFDDAGELLFQGNGTAAVSGTINIPANAVSLTTRMRVAMLWNSAPPSCGTLSYGEAEDYTVNIIGNDNTAPDVTLSTASTEVNGLFTVTATFTEDVTGLTLNDFLVLGNGTASSFSGSGDTYTFTVTPTAEGTISISLPANSAVDNQANGNNDSNILNVNYTPADNLAPSVNLTTINTEVSGSFTVNVNFSETITGLSINDFAISNGTASSLSGFGDSYTFTVTPDAEGQISVTLPANTVIDNASNNNTASNVLNVNYTIADTTPPSVTLTTSNSTVSESFTVNVNFSETITGLSSNDFTISNGSISNLSGSGDSYTFTVTPDAEGQISITLPANTVTDNAANDNMASNVLVVTYEENTGGGCDTPYNMSINQTTNQSSIYGNGAEASLAVDGNTSGNWWAEFSVASTAWQNEAWWEVDLGELADISTINVWNRTDCCSDFLSDYYIFISETPFTSGSLSTTLNQSNVISFHQTTIAGSPTAVSIGATGRYVRIQRTGAGFIALAEVEVIACPSGTGEPDTTPPSVTLSTPSTEVNAAFTVDATFSESIQGLSLNDFSITNGTASSLNSSGNTYSFTVTPSSEGMLSISLGANTVTDNAGNPNTASNTLMVNYTAPIGGGDCTTSSNIALDKTASQSSNYDATSALADLAIDGNTNGNWWAEFSVASTAWQNEAWWEVDLGEVATIDEINIWNRTDCCSDFLSDYYIFVSEVPFTSNSLSATISQSNVSNYHQTTIAGSPSTITINNSGRYIRIQRTGAGFMALAEVEVIGCFGGSTGGGDTTPPTANLTTNSTSVNGAFTVSTNFSETITGLTANDFSVINGTLSNLSGSGANYSFTITPTADGLVYISLPSNSVTDAAGNQNTASNTLSVTYTEGGGGDTTPPTATLSTSSNTVSGSFGVTVSFSESVTGLTTNDFTIINGTASNLNGSGASYNFTVTPTTDGLVSISLPSNSVTDAADNPNTASNTINVTYTAGTNTEYCAASGSQPWVQWIDNVTFADINNDSFKDGYGNYTNVSTNVDRENTYTISISHSFSWDQWDEHFAVWIDYNQDFDFDDPGELVLSAINPAGSPPNIPPAVTGDITIPSDAATGATRMRVAMQKEADPGACENFIYGEVEDYTITINNSTPFVSPEAALLIFQAEKKERAVELLWITNTEYNNSHFVIERSNDGNYYEVLEELESTETHYKPTYYQFIDDEPSRGINYYRVKQIAHDGSATYSSIEQVTFDIDLENFTLFPNPATKELFINLKSFVGETGKVTIYNTLGQEMAELLLEEIPSQPIRLELEGYDNGIYHLMVKIEGFNKMSRKFVISKL